MRESAHLLDLCVLLELILIICKVIFLYIHLRHVSSLVRGSPIGIAVLLSLEHYEVDVILNHSV
jgi:hypothetical protein